VNLLRVYKKQKKKFVIRNKHLELPCPCNFWCCFCERHKTRSRCFPNSSAEKQEVRWRSKEVQLWENRRMSWRVNQLGESGNSLFAPFGQELAVCVCARKCQPHLRRRNKFDNPHTPPGASLSHSLLFYNGESAQQQKTLFGDRPYSRFNESGEALWFVTRREWVTHRRRFRGVRPKST
jgi:hypothetical protein